MWVGRVACSLAHARFLVPQAPSRARACLDCRGGEAKHAGRVDGGGREGEGGRGEGAEATAAERASGRRRGQHGARASDGDEGAVRAEERGEATDGGGRRSRKAVTEKAATGIEWERRYCM